VTITQILNKVFHHVAAAGVPALLFDLGYPPQCAYGGVARFFRGHASCKVIFYLLLKMIAKLIL
jgi:hypothetical protein